MYRKREDGHVKHCPWLSLLYCLVIFCCRFWWHEQISPICRSILAYCPFWRCDVVIASFSLCKVKYRPGSRSPKSWAEKHLRRSEPKFSWLEAAICLSEPKRAKKICGSFFGEQCLLMHNGLSGSSITPHHLNIACALCTTIIIIFFPWSRPSILSLSLTVTGCGSADVFVAPYCEVWV